jgi:hypothetical protein
MKRITATILSLAFVLPLLAQDDYPPIVTDRPDQTESALSVPHKTLQIESGFHFSWRDKEGVETKDLGFNATLLRWGVLKRLEIRLGAAYAGFEQTDAATEETTSLGGFAPLAIGIKWNMLYGDGPIPTLAFLTSVDIPALASEDFNDGNVLQKILFAGSWTLSNTFSLGMNFGTIADWKDSDFTTIYSISLGAGIVNWLGAFFEYYGFAPAGEYSDQRINGGFTFPVRHNLQFDIYGGTGVSKNSPNAFAGFGFAWRIPK